MSLAFNFTRIAVLGASRGLGFEILQLLRTEHPTAKLLGLARKGPSPGGHIEWVTADLSQDDGQQNALDALSNFNPELIINCVGGGPFGRFEQKNWRDHMWAYQVSLLWPARLCHWALQSSTRQLVLLGSSVAESAADPMASSYSSAKHGLLGLFRSVTAEKPQLDLRLFSPGYMDTAMLPPGAKARSEPIWSAKVVAEDLLKWVALGPCYDHRRLAIRPSDL